VRDGAGAFAGPKHGDFGNNQIFDDDDYDDGGDDGGDDGDGHTDVWANLADGHALARFEVRRASTRGEVQYVTRPCCAHPASCRPCDHETYAMGPVGRAWVGPMGG
jgi:hypothetical protein